MNLFEAVKDAIPTRTAVERYGIEAKRNGWPAVRSMMTERAA